MSYRPNKFTQGNIFEPQYAMTERQRIFLDNSWCSYFREEIFPKIDEDMFAVLYADDPASRPCNPVNVTVGAELIKTIFGYSDDDMVEGMILDPRIQYALNTTSFEEQPISDKSLSRFRVRMHEYELETGIDLWHKFVESFSQEIAKLMKITDRVKRMDSMQVNANVRRLNRIELIYTCVSKLAIHIEKEHEGFLPEELLHYTDPDDFNRIFYYKHDDTTDDTLGQILLDAEQLLELSEEEFKDSKQYALLDRCLTEQTIVKDDKRQLRQKEDGGMDSNMLQNPSDPDATFHKKAGEDHVGYVMNLEQSVGENGAVITGYDVEPNNYSDSQMLKDSLNNMEPSEEPAVLVADGAYGGAENAQLASDKNVELATTSLTGKPTPDIIADFEFNDEGTRILACPNGIAPKSCSYSPSSGQCTASFYLSCCESCPYKKQCPAKPGKTVARITTSKKSQLRAISQRKQGTEEAKNLARLRNGIETVPSLFRRKYNIDHLPRGKNRIKHYCGSIVAASNIMTFIRFRKGMVYHAKNPVIG